MVRVVTHENNRQLINDKLPEAMIETYDDKLDRTRLAEAVNWADVIAIGPGIGKDSIAKELFEFAFFKSAGALVIDADALTILKQYKLTLKKEKKRDIIITPHIGEFVRLTDMDKESVLKDIVGTTQEVAQAYNLTCVTKDARTVIASKDGECYVNTTGNNGMAVAGTGDCLFGIIAALLGRGLSPLDASVYGCFIHGHAGDLAAEKTGKSGLLASDLIDEIKTCLEAADE